MIVPAHLWEERPDDDSKISQIPRKLKSGDEDEKAVCATGTLGDDADGSRKDSVRLYVEFD
jgi:hypothetical protein